jgi:hypothetical protein
MFGAGFIGWLFAQQHQNVKNDEENAGEPFSTALDDIKRRTAAMPHEHRAQADGQKNYGENQTNVLKLHTQPRLESAAQQWLYANPVPFIQPFLIYGRIGNSQRLAIVPTAQAE